MFIVNPNEMELHKKISAPLTHAEIEYMKSFGIDDGDGFISRKEYTMLTIIRIGRVEAKVVQQIRKQFQELLVLHGQKKLLSYEHLQRVSNKSFYAISRIFPMLDMDDDCGSQSSKLPTTSGRGKGGDDDSLSIDEELGMLPEVVIVPADSDSVSSSPTRKFSRDGGDNVKDKCYVESKKNDEIDKKKEVEEEEEEEAEGGHEDEDSFPSSDRPPPQLNEIAKKYMTNKKTRGKISNESYRNLKHSTSTKKHLQKVQKVSVLLLLIYICFVPVEDADL
jgi:hypothetical protein